MKLFSAAVFLLAALAAGCSDATGTTSSGQTSGSSGTQPDQGTSGTPDQGTSGGTSGTSGTSGTTAAKAPEAPTLTQLMKMTGSLHVVWDLPPNTTCDAIEGERKTATEPYKVVWTTPGTVDNKHDGTATKDAEYTYRLRCKAGATYSAYSNEMTKNPLK